MFGLLKIYTSDDPDRFDAIPPFVDILAVVVRNDPFVIIVHLLRAVGLVQAGTLKAFIAETNYAKPEIKRK